MTRLDIFNYSWSSVRLEIRSVWKHWIPCEERHVFDIRYKIMVYDATHSCWYYLSTRMGTLVSLGLWTRYLNDDALCITPCNDTACDFQYIPFDTLDALQQYINKEVMVEVL